MWWVVLWHLFTSRGAAHDPALAVAQAWEESRFDSYAVSRVVRGHRETGHWDMPFPATWQGPYFCGLWQVEAESVQQCTALRAFSASWLQRERELGAWLRFCRGDVQCALGGYGCGVAGAHAPDRCGAHGEHGESYPKRVLRRAREIYRQAGIGT